MPPRYRFVTKAVCYSNRGRGDMQKQLASTLLRK